MSDLSNVIYVGNITGVSGQVTVSGSGVTNANVDISLSSTGVTPGVYGNASVIPQITVDSYGRVSNVSLMPIDIDPEEAGIQLGGIVDQVVAGAGLTGGGSASTVTLALANTAVVPGTYGNASWVPELTINSRGQITSATTRRVVTGLSAIYVDGKILNTTANTSITLLSSPGTVITANAQTNTITVGVESGNIAVGGQLDQVIAGAGLVQSGNATVATLSLANTSVTPGTYGSSNSIPRVTVNSRGQITSVSTAPVPTGLTKVNVGGTTLNVGANDDLTITGGSGVIISSNTASRTISFSLADSVTIASTLTAGNLSTAGSITGGNLAIGGVSLESGALSGLSNVSSTVFSSGTAALNNGALSGVTSLETTGNATIGGSLTVTGNLTVQGNSTVFDTENLTVEDALIEIGRAQTSGALDTGLILSRGSDDDVFIGWQESQDRVVLALGDYDASSNSALTISNFANFRAGAAAFDSLTLGASTTVTAILNEANLASNASNALPTQSSVKSYVDNSLANLSQSANIAGDTGTGTVNLSTQSITISGTADRITTTASGQTVTVNLANTISGLTSVGAATFTTGTATLAGGTLTGITGLATSNLQISGSTGITSVITDLTAFSGNTDSSIATALAIKDYVDNNSGDGLALRAQITHSSSTNVGVVPDVSSRTYIGSRVVITVATPFSGNSVDHVTIAEDNGAGEVIVGVSDADILEAGTYVIDLPDVELTAGEPVVAVFRNVGGTPVTPTAGTMTVKVEYNWI